MRPRFLSWELKFCIMTWDMIWPRPGVKNFKITIMFELLGLNIRSSSSSSSSSPVGLFFHEIILNIFWIKLAVDVLQRDLSAVRELQKFRRSCFPSHKVHRYYSSHQAVANHGGIDLLLEIFKIDLQLLPPQIKHLVGQQQQSTMFEYFHQRLVEPFQVCRLPVVISQTEYLSSVGFNLSWNLETREVWK